MAAGRADGAGVVLGLDPHAVDPLLPLAVALPRAGPYPESMVAGEGADGSEAREI